MCSVRSRTGATHCAHWFGYGFGCKDTCISKNWKESNVGHFDTESKIAEKQVLFPTRSPENITIKYPRCIRRFEIKATAGVVITACQFAPPRETARFLESWHLWYFIPRNFITVLSRSSNWVNIGEKYQALYVRSLIFTGRNTVR